MEPWYILLVKLLILIPLKILELALNCFAFIIMATAWPFIQIIKIIKNDSNDSRTI